MDYLPPDLVEFWHNRITDDDKILDYKEWIERYCSIKESLPEYGKDHKAMEDFANRVDARFGRVNRFLRDSYYERNAHEKALDQALYRLLRLATIERPVPRKPLNSAEAAYQRVLATEKAAEEWMLLKMSLFLLGLTPFVYIFVDGVFHVSSLSAFLITVAVYIVGTAWFIVVQLRSNFPKKKAEEAKRVVEKDWEEWRTEVRRQREIDPVKKWIVENLKDYA